ncbi:MAG: hypothetical protein LBS91_05205 [Clostridiales Family XIII bacterium]|jgi:hypothetical protein|nr:hypothetical protein [Clostridiales Family XIII bacterium]
MEIYKILEIAMSELFALEGRPIDVVNITKPYSLDYAKQLSKVISKLSPLIGNMIEFATVDLLNTYDWGGYGKWIRQDPGFPDALFESDSIIPNPGIEIKAWFPFATEITARFKDSVTMFGKNNIDVALIAWLPEYVIWGKPQIIDVLLVSGKSVAAARDNHYHNPPDYIVFEPEDTSARTSNLQQTNTNGYKFQVDKSDIEEARQIVGNWGADAKLYSAAKEYQDKLKSLLGQFTYRLDTNYAKIDRIEHQGIEKFKTGVLSRQFHGKTISQWSAALSSKSDNIIESALSSLL